MREIGGYFELELPIKDCIMHSRCVAVNSGRHALEYILRGLNGQIKEILIPDYTCDSILQPIETLNMPYRFYNINEQLEICDGFSSEIEKEGTYLVVNNYFGIKDAYVKLLSEKYGRKLIVDNSQAWYALEIRNTKCFYSPRKFFGLPDGGMAYTDEMPQIVLNSGISWNRATHLLKRIDTGANSGYGDFHNDEATISDEPLTLMSPLTYRLLSSIDMGSVKRKRRRNYSILAEALGTSNMLNLPDIDTFECPMIYPFMTDIHGLREYLIENKIYVAQYWPNVLNWSDKDSVAFKYTQNIISLPIDHRYDENDMNYIIEIITKKQRK